MLTPVSFCLLWKVRAGQLDELRWLTLEIPLLIEWGQVTTDCSIREVGHMQLVPTLIRQSQNTIFMHILYSMQGHGFTERNMLTMTTCKGMGLRQSASQYTNVHMQIDICTIDIIANIYVCTLYSPAGSRSSLEGPAQRVPGNGSHWRGGKTALAAIG